MRKTRLIPLLFVFLLWQACNVKEKYNNSAEANLVEGSPTEANPAETGHVETALAEPSFSETNPSERTEVENSSATSYTKTVEIRKTANGYLLYRYGKPYFIKGAGGYVHFDKIREHGGNSVRLWTAHDAKSLLDKAHEHGLTFMSMCTMVKIM
jgi:hypothetical protein